MLYVLLPYHKYFSVLALWHKEKRNHWYLLFIRALHHLSLASGDERLLALRPPEPYIGGRWLLALCPSRHKRVHMAESPSLDAHAQTCSHESQWRWWRLMTCHPHDVEKLAFHYGDQFFHFTIPIISV